MTTQMPSKGSRVWVQRPSEGWRRGTVAGAEGGEKSLRVVLDCEQLGEAAGPEVTVPLAALEPANPVLLDGVRCVCCLASPGTATAAARDHPASCAVEWCAALPG